MNEPTDTQLEITEETITATVAYVDEAPAPQPDTDPHQERRDAAIGKTYHWHGRALEPWSTGRRSEWFALRNMRGEPSRLEDAGIILYLCSLTEPELLEARKDREAMADASWTWMNANIAPAEMAAACELADSLFDDAEATRAIPTPTGGPEPGN